ncbi:hypothetical protein CEXT_767381 [Caerostris extrusa]|uniref:Uncharacterized protein n=1 Tax=Caerostris extrusa TaxID=172846 RepID=A0AAV4SPJ5_CAEEX|nr:hypothetical protein CEXT_767381 [Caerostris extrusa]
MCGKVWWAIAYYILTFINSHVTRNEPNHYVTGNAYLSMFYKMCDPTYGINMAPPYYGKVCPYSFENIFSATMDWAFCANCLTPTLD